MSTSYASERPSGATSPAPPVTGWVGLVVFGGIMLLTLGLFQGIEGAVALYHERFYLVTSDGLLLEMDYQVWGWTHLLFGLLSLTAGAGVLLGRLWGRILGVLITFLGALLHLLFLAASPVWCTILISMDILVIYALTAHGSEVRRHRP
ncbi:DUF7144 family membrane protein [Actinoplanes awajinensis]|uniref:DUF7144 domain-containing protein n=1 Tax=Actinoplanes awajinensis subsp. mycoplanecinus TaxID=135947 RepID=A0A117MP74_9ACTN|nr:hypothetical protein [Actinoplanes awajinensis]KUL28164.1 hypothetical protein ADL15_32750 [Actinoplanes awajinensis subsp. mycoplanecinus]